MPVTHKRNLIYIIFSGLVISFAIFFFVQQWEEKNRHNEFQYKAEDHAAAIQTELEHTLTNIENARFLIEYDINIEHSNPNNFDDFMPMVENLVLNNPALVSIAWATLENTMAKQPSINQQHLKVLYIKKGRNVGRSDSDYELYDYYDDHISASLLNKKKSIQVFAHQDDHENGNELSFIGLVKQNETPVGTLIVEWHIDTLIEKSLENIPVSAQDITLVLIKDDGSKHTVYTHTSRSRVADETNIHTGFNETVPFEFSGKHWQLEFEAAPQFLRNHPIILAWPTLAFCLLLTFFIAWYVRYTSNQTATIERKVKVRTKELASSQSLLKAVINHSPAVIFIKDMEGKYILINKRYEELFNITNEDIIGKTAADVFDQDLAKTLQENDIQVIKKGQPITFEETVPDERGLRHYYSLKFPLYDDHNQMYALCGIATDITEQKEITGKVAKLASVIEQTDEMVLVTDKHGLIEYVNPAFERISGYTAAEMIGNTSNIIKSGTHSEQFYADMWNTLNAGKLWLSDFTNRNKTGELYEVTQSITPIMNDKSEIIGFSSVQRDVTEHRQMQSKLQHSDRVESLGVLAGGIAHDFNNLLTAILGNASLAVKKVSSNSPILKYLNAITNASHSAADLCKQMLAYSGKGQFVIKAVDLSVLIEDMAKLISVSLAKNVVLKYDLHEQLPAVDADVAQMQQVVLNLITNASESMEEKSGVISMATGVMDVDIDYLNHCVSSHHTAGQYVYMEVSDTGCGMDRSTQKKIFDPFFSTKFTGRGLGMSAMLGIVQGHKGAIRIYSELGMGTTIKVIFPISDGVILEPEKNNSLEPVWQSSGTVLIIDDEEGIREVATLMLEDFGFHVLTANDGKEGVDVFAQHHADISLVLLDMTMPIMDGSACFSKLKSIEPDVRVLLSSGYNEQDTTNRFDGKGLAGFIQKPYSADAFAKKLQEILKV